MKNPWLYILARLAAFGVPLGILLALNFHPIYSVAIATALGLAFSLLFLSGTREELSKRLYDRFNRETEGETAEDLDDDGEAVTEQKPVRKRGKAS
ncbi:MAG: hypothetical protein RL510_914 [Actinomycetota bacterium]